MSRVLRTSLLLAAVVAAVLAFAVLRPEERPSTVSATPAPASETRAAPADEEPSPTPSPTPAPPLLKAGSVRELSVRRGEKVSFRVRHSSDEEIHVHGYDITRPVPAGKTVSVSFPATIEGIFEIELEHSHTPIGSLRVEP